MKKLQRDYTLQSMPQPSPKVSFLVTFVPDVSLPKSMLISYHLKSKLKLTKKLFIYKCKTKKQKSIIFIEIH